MKKILPYINLILLLIIIIFNNNSIFAINTLDIVGNVNKKPIFIDHFDCKSQQICIIGHLMKNIIANDINNTAIFYGLKSLNKKNINEIEQHFEKYQKTQNQQQDLELNFNSSQYLYENNLKINLERLNFENFNFFNPLQKSILLNRINIDYFLIGYLTEVNDLISFKYEIYYTKVREKVLNGEIIFSEKQYRYNAHLIANQLIQKIAGYNPYFHSKIAFVENYYDANKTWKRKLGFIDRDGFGLKIVELKLQKKILDEEIYTPIYSHHEHKMMFINMTTGSPQLFSVDFGNWEQVKQIKMTSTEHINRVLSPKSKKHVNEIMFVSIEDDDNMKIYELNLDTLYAKKIFTENHIILSATAIEKDNSIIYQDIDNKTGKKQIYKIYNGIFGQIKKCLSRGDGSYSEPTLSPDENWIAFTKFYNNMYHIGIMKIDGSDERILFSEYKTERPSWNQNSLELVFSFKNSKNDFSKIKIIDIIGNEILTIKTKNKHSILEPHWFYIQQ